MSSPQTLDMQKKKEMDQFKILADQMARLGLDFGDMDLSVSKEDKPRKSKKLDSTNKSIDISNIAKKDSVREDSTPKSPSVSPKDKIEPSQDKKIIEEDDFEPIIANQLRSGHRLLSKKKTSKCIDNSQEKNRSASASSNEIPQTTSSPVMTTQNPSNLLTTNNNEPFSDNQSMVDQVEVVYMRPDFDEFKLSDEEESFTNDTTVMSTKVHHHAGKLSLYEREMKHLKMKEKLLNAKRLKLIQAREDALQEAPEVNEIPKYLNKSRVNDNDYVPLYERAGQIHAQKLTEIALNEERKKRQQEIEDRESELDRYRKDKKKFNQADWEKFIEKQMKWKNDVIYKKKAAELLKEHNDTRFDYKPKINAKSKKIISKMQKETDGTISEAYIRLHRDKEEHAERQKIREMDSLPSFHPKINKDIKSKNKKIKNSSRLFNQSANTFEPVVTTNSRNPKNINTKSSFDYDSSTSKLKIKEPINNIRSSLSKSKKNASNSQFEFRSSLDIDVSGIPQYDNQSEFMGPPQEEQEVDEDNNYTTARYKVSLEKTKSGALRQKKIPVNVTIEENKNTDTTGRSTITTCIGMPEMFMQRAKMIDEMYKKNQSNNINTNGENMTEADSLYKINVRNSTMGREVEDKVVASKEYSDFFKVN